MKFTLIFWGHEAFNYNKVSFLDHNYKWPICMCLMSTPMEANGSLTTRFSWAMKCTSMGFMENSCPMKVSSQRFMGHKILWQVFMENSRPMKVSPHVFMGHEIPCDKFSCEIHESLNKRMYFHGKFMARNTAMKFSFCSFQGPWKAFHGLFTGNSKHFHKSAAHSDSLQHMRKRLLHGTCTQWFTTSQDS